LIAQREGKQIGHTGIQLPFVVGKTGVLKVCINFMNEPNLHLLLQLIKILGRFDSFPLTELGNLKKDSFISREDW
jgi:hypothetical protein